MISIQPLVPLVGTTVAGPLGVAHLPRMWYKGVLSAAGILPAGYFDNYKGFNQRVVDRLGLEPDAWFAFLATMPDYPAAEDYVRAHATRLDEETIAAHNADIATFERPEESAALVRAQVGLDDSTLRVSSMLINLDDWHAFRDALVAHRADGIEPIVPMVSSAQTGPLGIPHLPRLWIKALLAAVGALPQDWKTGINCGFDKRLAGMIGLDLEAASAFIEAELPHYLVFEAWVRDHIAAADDAQKSDWTAQIHAMQKSEEQLAAERIEAGDPDLTLRGTVLLNDMVDWKHMHDRIAASPVAS